MLFWHFFWHFVIMMFSHDFNTRLKIIFIKCVVMNKMTEEKISVSVLVIHVFWITVHVYIFSFQLCITNERIWKGTKINDSREESKKKTRPWKYVMTLIVTVLFLEVLVVNKDVYITCHNCLFFSFCEMKVLAS